MKKRNIIEEPFFNRKMKILIFILILAIIAVMAFFFKVKNQQEDVIKNNSASIESVVSSEKNDSESSYSKTLKTLSQSKAEKIVTESINESFKAIQNLQLLPTDNVNSDIFENKKFSSLLQIYVDPVTALNTFNKTVNFTTQVGNLIHGQNGDNQEIKTPVNTDSYTVKTIKFSKLNQINNSLYVIGTTIDYQIGNFSSKTKLHFLINSQNGKITITKLYQTESDFQNE